MQININNYPDLVDLEKEYNILTEQWYKKAGELSDLPIDHYDLLKAKKINEELKTLVIKISDNRNTFFAKADIFIKSKVNQ